MDCIEFIGMIEAAYRLDGDEDDWLRDLLAAMLPAFDHGLGAYAYTYDLNNPARPISFPVSLGAPDYVAPVVFSSHMTSPPGMLSVLLGAGAAEPYATANEILARSHIPLIREAQRQHPVSLDGQEVKPVSEWGIYDTIGMNAANPGGWGVVVASGLTGPIQITPRDRERFGKIAAHVAATHRLRRALVRGAGPKEAILEPDGACVHAVGPARSRTARENLRLAAQAIDRARSSLRHDPDEALTIWRALCAGRWTLVDRFESDGRRFLIARENAPSSAFLRALTTRERQVTAFAALGQPNKLVAYSLGISQSMVATHLKSAMKKLGVQSRVELINTCMKLGGLDMEHDQDTVQEE